MKKNYFKFAWLLILSNSYLYCGHEAIDPTPYEINLMVKATLSDQAKLTADEQARQIKLTDEQRIILIKYALTNQHNIKNWPIRVLAGLKSFCLDTSNPEDPRYVAKFSGRWILRYNSFGNPSRSEDRCICCSYSTAEITPQTITNLGIELS